MATIREMQTEAADNAARNSMIPTVVWDDMSLEPDLKGIPNLGDYVPYGWRMAEESEFSTDAMESDGTLFVDASGWGSAGESALTQEQFYSAVRSILAEALERDQTVGFAITEVGQFQAYVGVFVRE